MASPDELELRMTLRAAVERFDELRGREAFAEGWDPGTTLPQVEQVLHLLAAAAPQEP